MKADTYARLLVLQALVEADTGYLLRGRANFSAIKASLIARLGDVVEQEDAVDELAAGRVYDAIVDLLAEMPDEDHDLMIEATIRFQRAIDHVIERGIGEADFNSRSTWASALIELTETVADLYQDSAMLDERETLFLHSLLQRINMVGERLALLISEDARHELRSDMNRMALKLVHGQPRTADIDAVIRPLQVIGAQWRPSTARRMGRFVLRQLFGRQDQTIPVASQP